MGCAFSFGRVGRRVGRRVNQRPAGKPRSGATAKCNRFRNFKERGEWVEALFIAELLRRGYTVLKPWGDSQPFDVALNFGNRILRVQVKSTSYRVSTGYRCEFHPNIRGRQYTPKLLDFFVGYVVPQETWYVIPAPVLFNASGEPTSPI